MSEIQPSGEPEVVEGATAPIGDMGQIYLASGQDLSVRPSEGVWQVGASSVVPRGVEHTYEITEDFTAVEAPSPPAQVGGRDQEPSR
jgi:hypothetical protein